MSQRIASNLEADQPRSTGHGSSALDGPSLRGRHSNQAKVWLAVDYCRQRAQEVVGVFISISDMSSWAYTHRNPGDSGNALPYLSLELFEVHFTTCTRPHEAREAVISKRALLRRLRVSICDTKKEVIGS
ncbi:hypothetical protein B5807_09656 [Epicoccum nigrum]|jgi:hypothetical protein|uniref:Uncharacterized protein n=1 Tax=Epicoccum nigrum TaxID=105696 RepID=A0A1Y2LSC5_EPING|nr:hypothetical protein B5807_09656 [Epicoccum nigrum]